MGTQEAGLTLGRASIEGVTAWASQTGQGSEQSGEGAELGTCVNLWTTGQGWGDLEHLGRLGDPIREQPLKVCELVSEMRIHFR